MPKIKVVNSVDISSVPVGFPVGFCLLTHGMNQYVAYYNEKREMTIASRKVGADQWQYKILPTKVGWDSHNYITMVMDENDHLHVSGNMHCVPLIYFRMTRKSDISSLKIISFMTGKNENQCTYPAFMRGAKKELIFHYRDGSSGSGNEIYNIYDLKTKKWKRLMDKPLTNGFGKINAYMYGPIKGPDNMFHLAWVWRDSPDCSTNHDPSYARSRDLKNWETIKGKSLSLPISLRNKGALIDAVPIRGGIINGSLKIGFDSKNKVVATYHKFDAKGKTQAYAARIEKGRWVSYQISKWNYRWDFKGGGSIRFDISLGAIKPHSSGKLALSYHHVKYGNGILVISEKTFKLIGVESQQQKYPEVLLRPRSKFKGMKINWSGDLGESPDASFKYVLRWETLGQNRDQPRKGLLPKASVLKVYKISVDTIAGEYTGYVDKVRGGVLRWLESVRYKKGGWGRWKYNSNMKRPWALQASGIAIDILKRLNALDEVSAKQKKEAIRFYKSCLDPKDNLFKDPLETAATKKSKHHTWEQIWGQRNGSTVKALSLLGEKALFKKTPKLFADLNKVDGRAWTLSLNWKNPWAVGENWMRAIKAFLKDMPKDKRKDTIPVLAKMFATMESEILDSKTGYPTKRGCSNNMPRAMAGLFKIMFAYLAVGRPLPNPKKIIDSTLKLQLKSGEFGFRRDMTMNWDALCVLRVLDTQLKGRYRHADIIAAGEKLCEVMLKVYLKKDGGFAFHGEKCLVVHHSITLCKKSLPISDMLGTNMVLWCLGYVDEWKKADFDKLKNNSLIKKKIK